MVDQLPKSFFALEERVKGLYALVPSLAIEDPDDHPDLHCSSCQKLLIRAYGAPLCPHLFCGPCLRQLITKDHPHCPLDRKAIQAKKVSHQQKEKAVERRVSRLKVRCPIHVLCSVVKPVIEISDHVESCEYKASVKQEDDIEEEEDGEEVEPGTYVLKEEYMALKGEFETYKTETSGQLRTLMEQVEELMAAREAFVHQLSQMQLQLDEVSMSVEDPRGKGERAEEVLGGVWWRMETSSLRAGKKLMREEFDTSAGLCFRAEVAVSETGGVDLRLKLLPGARDEGRRWPFSARARLALYDESGQDPPRLDKTIPFSMPRSEGRKLSALCVTSLLTPQQLQSHFATQTAFHLQLQLLR